MNRRLAAVLVFSVISSMTGTATADDAGTGASLAADTLIYAGDSLDSVDLMTGTTLSDAGGGVAGSAEAGSFAMANADPDLSGALDIARAEMERRKAEETRKQEEARKAAALTAGAPASAQTEIGPDGCPTAVPANTLRKGAASIGVAALCARSVAGAATPTAAKAIKFVFQNLGAPYTQTMRMSPGYFDCSSYVSRAYIAAGVPNVLINGSAPTTRNLAPYPGWAPSTWLRSVSWGERMPGDLLVTPPTRADGGGHVMMALSDGYMIHTAATGDVSNVTLSYPESKIGYVKRVTM